MIIVKESQKGTKNTKRYFFWGLFISTANFKAIRSVVVMVSGQGLEGHIKISSLVMRSITQPVKTFSSMAEERKLTSPRK